MTSDKLGGTPAAPAPRDSLETMRAEWETNELLSIQQFVERMFAAWQLEQNAKVQLRKELAAAVGELDRGAARSGAPEQQHAKDRYMAAEYERLRQEWDEAQRYERTLDVRDFAQRCLDALAVGGIAPAPAPEPPDCEAAHGNNINGCCPRCGAAVRVVGFQSCECGREQIEQLAPALPTDSDLIALGEAAVTGYIDFPKARAWFAKWRGARVSERPAPEASPNA